MTARGHRAMALKKRCSSLLWTGLMLFALSGCTFSFSSLEFKRAENAASDGKAKEAVKHYDRVMKRDPESDLALKSARKASRLALFELKDFKAAIEYFEYLVVHSQDEKERIDAQKQIAEIAFEKLTDYTRAIAEYNKLLNLKTTPEEFLDYKLKVAKAYYYNNDFYQAETEVKSALQVAEKGQNKFDLELFLANIYFNTKRVAQAVDVYQNLVKEYPKLAEQENVHMNIVVCYEELEKFDEAIDLLEQMKSFYKEKQFLDLKIDRLKERKANLPGSKGLRK